MSFAMNNYSTRSCCPSHALLFREQQCCSCISHHYRHVQSQFAQIPTLPVVIKPSITDALASKSVMARVMERKEAPKKQEKTVLKFGIESILGRESIEQKPLVNMESSRSNLKSLTTTVRIAKAKAVPPKRAVFSEYQRRQLELEFLSHKYISKQERKQLASRLSLSESQVRIWFQNRRMKWRNRQEREMMRRHRIGSF